MACSSGQYVASVGATACATCPGGTYQSGVGSSVFHVGPNTFQGYSGLNGVDPTADFIWSTAGAASSAPTYVNVYFTASLTVAAARAVAVTFGCDDYANLIVNGVTLASSRWSSVRRSSTTLEVSFMWPLFYVVHV